MIITQPASEKAFVIWPLVVQISNMLRNDLDGEATPVLTKPQAQQLAPGEITETLAPKELPVSHMDDGTFQRCLAEVVTVHDRLLSKLAE